jgi:topoisomerase-4 subunit A
LELEFGGKYSERENEIIEVAEFIGVKSWKAKGKRLSNYEVGKIVEIEPVLKDEDDKPKSDELIELDEPVEQEPVEAPKPKEKLSFNDIPFEIKRPKKDDPDPTQMSLF